MKEEACVGSGRIGHRVAEGIKPESIGMRTRRQSLAFGRNPPAFANWYIRFGMSLEMEPLLSLGYTHAANYGRCRQIAVILSKNRGTHLMLSISGRASRKTGNGASAWLGEKLLMGPGRNVNSMVSYYEKAFRKKCKFSKILERIDLRRA